MHWLYGYFFPAVPFFSTVSSSPETPKPRIVSSPPLRGKTGSSHLLVQSYVRLVFPAPGCVAAMLLRRTFVDEDREIPSARACRVLPDCPRHLSAQNSSLIISSSPKAYFREYERLTCRLRLGLPSRLLQTLRMLKDQMTVSLSYRKSLRPCSTKDVRQSVATFCQYLHLWGI